VFAAPPKLTQKLIEQRSAEITAGLHPAPETLPGQDLWDWVDPQTGERKALRVTRTVYGYPHNDSTAQAKEELHYFAVRYAFFPAPSGVHPDNPDPRFRRMPTLVVEGREADNPVPRVTFIASGIDEVLRYARNGGPHDKEKNS
jgi:hypothetical protein